MNSPDLRELLQQIYDEHGEITPRRVLETGRDPDHPLHTYFDWNNDTAGESWRLEQARRLIRVVRITYKQADEHDGNRSVRAYHAIRSERGYVYEPAEVIATDPFKRRLLLNEMEREWKALRRRYGQFSEFADMVRKDIGSEDAA